MRLEEEYLTWNSAIAETLFPHQDMPVLAFLDLEGNALSRLAECFDTAEEDVVPTVLSKIKPLLNTRTNNSTFDWFVKKTRAWRISDQVDVPPALALLAIFALAASRMESSANVSSANYYGRLSELLGLENKRLVNAYRLVTADLWNSLEEWLNHYDGYRGLPITFSLGGHEHIGKARAQALLRDVDRRRLYSFFQTFDLSPLSEMTPKQLEPLFEDWVVNSRVPSRQLRDLWEQKDARPHLLTAISGILAGWDGHLSDRDDSGRVASRFRLAMRWARLRRKVEISYIIEVPKFEQSRQAILKTSSEDATLELIPGRSGEMTMPGLTEIVTPQVMLEAQVTIVDQYAGELIRQPRPLIVLRQDEMTGTWLEVTQVRLGDEIKVLVRDGFDVLDVIADVSGTEWTIHTSKNLPGLPEKWSLIEGIIVRGRPRADLAEIDDRTALVPITQIAFEFAGGLKLPTPRGSDPHFHYASPPALTVSAAGEPFKISLFDLAEDTRLLLDDPQESPDGDTIVLNLAHFDLDPGHYCFVLEVAGTQNQKDFWLVRSGAPLGTTWEFEPVVHDADDPLFAVNRTQFQPNDPEFTVRGLPDYLIEDPPPLVPTENQQLATAPWWRRERKQKTTRVTVPIVDESSCVWTGSHYMEVERAMIDERGYAHGKSRGRCRDCGREKEYFNSYYRNRRRWLRNQESSAREPKNPRQSTHREQYLGSKVDWDLALDMVLAIGGGDARLLRRITQQFDASARFYHEFATTLETLGHIEICRDLENGEITRWETAPTYLVDLGDHRRFIGHWTAEDFRYLEKVGVPIERQVFDDAPRLTTTTESVESIQNHYSGIEVRKDVESAILLSLPALSDLLRNLPVDPIPNVLRWQRYDAKTDDWQEVSAVTSAGAYRSVGYGREYFLVSDHDLQMQQARKVNVALAKHASAMMDHRYPPLLAYSASDKQLIVPLGAPLPGMYGRAATLISGKPPRRHDIPGIGSYVVYQEIEPDFAQRMANLIGS